MLYNLNGDLVIKTLKKYKLLGKGEFGSCYNVNNKECLKVFYFSEKRIPKSFEIMINNKYLNMANLLDLYLDSNNLFKGYLMELLLVNKNLNTSNMSYDYILNSFHNLMETAIKLGNQNILMLDICKRNTVFTNNGIYLVDFDMYDKIDADNTKIIFENEKSILYLFRELVMGSSFIDDYSNERLLDFLGLFNYNNPNHLFEIEKADLILGKRL